MKAAATVGKHDFAALETLSARIGERFRAGVVLYLGDRCIPVGDKHSLVPLPALWAP